MSAATAAVQAVDGKTILLDRDRSMSMQMDKLEVRGVRVFLTTKYQSNNTVTETNFAENVRTHNVSQICLSLESSLQVASRPFRKTVKHVWETTSLRSKLSESTLKRHKDNSKSLWALHWLTRQSTSDHIRKPQIPENNFWLLVFVKVLVGVIHLVVTTNTALHSVLEPNFICVITINFDTNFLKCIVLLKIVFYEGFNLCSFISWCYFSHLSQFNFLMQYRLCSVVSTHLAFNNVCPGGF